MKNVSVIGRMLFAIPFAIFGLNHFLFVDFYIGTVSSFIPLGPYTVILTGIFLILASLSIIFNKYIKVASILLSVLLLTFILTIHIPGLFDADPVKWKFALIELLKDTSLLGGSLMIAGMVFESEKSN